MNVDSPSPNTDVIEGLAAAVVEERGAPPVKAGKGRARMFKVVDQTGAVVGLTTHGKVLKGAARVAALEIEVQEGRPEQIMCADCPALVKVPKKGSMIPKRCARCAKTAKHKQWREWRAANPEKAREQRRKLRAANPEKLREQQNKLKAANPEKWRERAREWDRKRRAANPEKARERDLKARLKQRARKKAELEAERPKRSGGAAT